MVVRIAVVTGRRASREVRKVIDRIRDSIRHHAEIDVIVLPVEIASLITMDILDNTIRNLEDSYDLIIVPGTLPYTVNDLRKISSKIVKGPPDPSGLSMLSLLLSKGLKTLIEKGSIDEAISFNDMLNELARLHEEKPGIEVCGVKIPLRPPPFILVAEIFVKKFEGKVVEYAEKLSERIIELSNRGADIVVLGFGPEWEKSSTIRLLEKVYEKVGPIGLDSPDKELLMLAARREITCLSMSAWPGDNLLSMLPREHSVVVIPFNPLERQIEIMVERRVQALEKGVQEALLKGLKPIADPLVDPPLMGLVKSIEAYMLASRSIRDAPLMAGIANVYELMDVDTHGVIALLVSIFGEAGASIMLLGEESRKAYYAVTEAAIASTMTSIAMIKGSTPKDLGIDMLSIKEKKRQEPIRLPSKPDIVIDASYVASWHGYRQDLSGSHLITVEDGLIRDTYIGRKGTIEIRGKNAEEIYKAIVYLELALEPSHLAFLGKELCRAETALKLHKSYVMEQDPVKPPWHGAKFYNARTKSIKVA